MQASAIPYKFAAPFAADAGPTFITNPIPLTTSTPNAASLQQGFPASTFAPGGAPRGDDFNGILFAISAWAQWFQAGGSVPYDSVFQTASGGYPNAAQVPSLVYPGVIWISQVDNNTSDPDTGGANWAGYTPRPFVSAPAALGSTGNSWAHTLPAAPSEWGAYLVCLSSNNGYSTGQRANVPATTYTAGGGGGGSFFSVGSDDTDVFAIWNNPALISLTNVGGTQYITPADWEIVLWAKL